MEIQTEKKPKAEKAKERPKDIQKLIDIGIEIRYAKFKETILSIDKTPETGFYAPEPDMKSAKVAKMWATPHYLVTEQENKIRGVVYKLIPLGNVADTIVA